MQKKGGIRLKTDSIDINEAFAFFIHNSTNRYIGGGKIGMTFLFTLNAEVESPYVSLRSNSLGHPVNELIVKICFITDPIPFSIPISSIITNKHINSTNETTITPNFVSECKTQSDIFENSNQDNEAICPSVALFNILSDSEFIALFKEITYYDGFNRFLSLKEKITKKYQEITEIKVGIIAMEFLSNSSSIAELYIKNNDDRQFIQNSIMAFYELYRLFKIGYFHGDFNLSNIFVAIDYKYFNKYNGRAFLIDFGASFPVPPHIDRERDYSPSEFVELLFDNPSPLYTSVVSDFSYRSLNTYDWIKMFLDPQLSTILHRFEQDRSIVIKEYHRQLNNYQQSESEGSSSSTSVGGGDNNSQFDFSQLSKLLKKIPSKISNSEKIELISHQENVNHEIMLENISI
jgi:hypothetical protein